MKIPIWVDKRHGGERSPESVFWPRLPTLLRDFDKDPVTNVWVCLAELRVLFDIPHGKGQDDEWLACGHISRCRVVRMGEYNSRASA